MARHESLTLLISDEQEANLRKLAAYLLTLPEDYPDFEMDSFTSEERGVSWMPAYVPECGTAACAVGHGPNAGILPDGEETWLAYSVRSFIPNPKAEVWEWCFGAAWSDADNTVHGAAKRILWLLEKGLPEDCFEQLYGEEPLCYTDMVLA